MHPSITTYYIDYEQKIRDTRCLSGHHPGRKCEDEAAHLISDGMVIQQNSEVRLWGWAGPGHKVTVSPSWKGQAPVSAKADGEGRWTVSV